MTKLGAIDLVTGQVLDWAPSFPWNCNVHALEVLAGRVYVGGCDLSRL